METPKKNILLKYLPLFLIVGFVLVFVLLITTTPEAKRRSPAPPNKISVEVLELKTEDIPVVIQSFGLIAPRIESRLVSQVSGKVISVSDTFRDGGFFKKDDLLISIEALDYQSDVDVALANLAASERVFQEELAQTQQAEEDWKRLGNGTQPSDLTLRKPQLLAAKAAVTSANAQLNRAKLNLQRTQILAPFDGRVRNKSIDVGQVVGINTSLGEIYAVDAIEVTLPVKNSELGLLNLPEDYRDPNQHTNATPKTTKVELTSTLLGKETWEAEIVRTAGAIDSASRQLSVTAQVIDPYGPKSVGKYPLKIGEYVTANIAGKTLKDSIAIPNKAIYQGAYVYVYRDEKAFREDITVYWQDETHAVISAGLNVGDQLIVTPLGQVTSGTAVTISTLSQSSRTAKNHSDKKMPKKGREKENTKTSKKISKNSE